MIDDRSLLDHLSSILGLRFSSPAQQVMLEASFLVLGKKPGVYMNTQGEH